MKLATLLPGKFVYGLLLMCAVAGTASAQLKGDSFASAKAKGTADVVFTFVETPGFTKLVNRTELQGFCPDLMQLFAVWLKKTEGIELKPSLHTANAANFKQFMAGVKSGQDGVFGLGNITITPERENEYAFSPPYITNVAILITHKSVPTLEDMSKIGTSFAGMEAMAVKATLNEKRLQDIKSTYYPGLSFRFVGSSVDALDAVSKDPKVFAHLDFTYYLEALKQGMPIKRHPAGDESNESFGIIMPKDSDWAPVMKRFLTSDFLASTEYRKMVADNLGSNALKLLDAVASTK